MMDLLWREERGGRDTRAEWAESPEAQRLSWALFPDLYRVPGKKKWYKTGTNSLLEQVSADSCIHCAEWIVQEVDVCILIHGSRKWRETSGEDTTHSLGLISESWRCPTIPGSFQELRERTKTLLHTDPLSKQGLRAHVHKELQRRRGRMTTETPFTWQGWPGLSALHSVGFLHLLSQLDLHPAEASNPVWIQKREKRNMDGPGMCSPPAILTILLLLLLSC